VQNLTDPNIYNGNRYKYINSDKLDHFVWKLVKIKQGIAFFRTFLTFFLRIACLYFTILTL